METMIRTIVIAGLLLACISATGQKTTNRTHEEKAKTEARGLKKQFSLTDAQTDKCELVIKKYAEKLSEKYTAGDSIKFCDAKEQMVKKRDEEIKTVLTANQKSKFDKWVKEKRKPKGNQTK